MRVFTANGKDYRLPNIQNPFQQAMYVHLIDWKWRHITKEEGYYTHRGGRIPYDAILPESLKASLPIVYPEVVDALRQHHKILPFKLHQHFNHMASSQAANANLFLPILLSPHANTVLRQVKDDFGELATDQLDRGFQIEYWGPECDGRGLLGDHTKLYGTDSDIAIAYYDNTDRRELRLWLIEHKLTESGFTKCRGITSRGRRQEVHDCRKSFSELLKSMDYCYYHETRKFKYWEITDEHQDFFCNHSRYSECPFKGGMNQLWRNQLLGLAIERYEASPFRKVSFSVIRHTGNRALDRTIGDYRKLIANNERFSVLTLMDVVQAAEAVGDRELDRWADWYRGVYRL